MVFIYSRFDSDISSFYFFLKGGFRMIELGKIGTLMLGILAIVGAYTISCVIIGIGKAIINVIKTKK